MTKQKLSKEHFLEGDISDKSPEFKEGVKFGVNNTLEKAILLIQSKFGPYSSTCAIVTKILKAMKIEDGDLEITGPGQLPYPKAGEPANDKA